MTIVDTQLVVTAFGFVMGGMAIVGVLIAMGFGAPYVLIAVPFFGAIYFVFQKRYRKVQINSEILLILFRFQSKCKDSRQFLGVLCFHIFLRLLTE